MDDRNYASPIVRDWCHRFHVCPEGRDLAMPCMDLATVWWKIDRPGWLLWFLAMGAFNDPSRWNESVANLYYTLPSDLYKTLSSLDFPDSLPPGWVNCLEVDPQWCDRIRSAISCPFARPSVAADCSHTINDDGTVTPIGAGSKPVPTPVATTDPGPKAKPVAVHLEPGPDGRIRTVAVDGRAFVPADEATFTINRQRDVIECVRDENRQLGRLFRWSMFGLAIGAIVAMGLVWLVRWEDEQC